jgi:ferric-dicitrate binding protein FerR (iron transport regulator)
LEDLMRAFCKAALSIILCSALVGAPTMASSANPAPAPLGMVLQANKAQVGVDITGGGSTIYDGDLLQTQTGGTLRAQLGKSQMSLSQNTAAQVHGFPNGFSADLGGGTVVVSSAEGQSFEVLADGTSIRPVGTQVTVAQITKVNANELLLNSTRGALQITMGDEVRTIEPGTSYRMEVEAEASGPGPQGAQGAPSHAGRNRHFVLYLVAAGVAAGTGVLIWRALESPSGL